MDGNISETLQHINRARSLARGSLNEARRSVWNLRPQALERVSLVEALRQEVGRLAQSSNIIARFEVSENKRELPLEIETAVLRIGQESLANIKKHAQATEVKVELGFDKSNVILTIRDNGVGFVSDSNNKGTQEHRGFGLISMQDRTKSLGGTFEVQSEEGQGTVIKIVIPVM